MCLKNFPLYSDKISEINHLLHEFICRKFSWFSISIFKHINSNILTFSIRISNSFENLTVISVKHQLNLITTIQNFSKRKLPMRTIKHYSTSSLNLHLRIQNHLLTITKSLPLILCNNIANKILLLETLSIGMNPHFFHFMSFLYSHFLFWQSYLAHIITIISKNPKSELSYFLYFFKD